jgi:hypothetical protein
MAHDEELKLLSTLLIQYPTHSLSFLESLDSILKLFDRIDIPSPPIKPPISSLINCLVGFPFPSEYRTGRIPWPPCNVEKLVKVLEDALQTYSQDELETTIPPIVTLLASIAQDGPPEVKVALRTRLLPSEEDRTVPLGKGSSLPHILVKSSMDAISPGLKNALGMLLMALSDNSSENLVRNVGYGCASGLLFSLGIPIPSSSNEVDDAMSYSEINPVTGQHRDMERQTELPEMTQDEKEREAERLFVLFERLNQTGVMNVQNPVVQAMQSGRIQELGSDDEDGDN